MRSAATEGIRRKATRMRDQYRFESLVIANRLENERISAYSPLDDLLFLTFTVSVVILVFALQQHRLCSAARANLHCTRGVFAEQRASLQCSSVENSIIVELLQKRSTNSSVLVPERCGGD